METLGEAKISRSQQGDVVFSVTAAGAGSGAVLLEAPNSSVAFGSDERRTGITLVSSDPRHRIPPLAGVIWRQDDVLWLRNLSLTYEIGLITTVGAPRRTLARGGTTAIPAPFCRLIGPGGLDLLVEQHA